MVVGAFPAAKLGILLFKQISKPIANFAKERAKNNRFFRTYVCMPPAHFYNWCEVQSKMWIMNLGKPVNIPQLNEQMAIELGANLLGEGIIFVLGAALLIFEYNRSSKKEAAKEEQFAQEREHLNNVINELYFSVQKQDTQINEMQRNIYDLETRAVVKPWVPKKDDKGSGNQPPKPAAPILEDKSKNVTQPRTDDKNVHHVSAPYAERGIILRSLNYIQLDVLNTPHFETAPEETEPSDEINTNYNRQPSVVTNALNYIENDVKGLL
ncbi:optic atrophy 3 protein homolog [Arctopsyche grandis]|uniref:optic atrophy 3 protein homolog n=1 Tax=Arctopsyche grandis TaxID=121162 RepID=UPI00406D7DAE